MGFKENLRAEMEYKDIKPKELSELTGISVNTLRNYINGHNALPNIYSAVKIAKALGTTVENLVYTPENQEEKEDEKNPPPPLQEIFVQLPDNDRKSVMALVEEMFSHI